MLLRSRLIRLLLCALLSSSVLFAQDKKDRDSDDRGYHRDSDDKDSHRDSDDRNYHHDSDVQCDPHQRISSLDYLYLPGFPGARASLGIAVNAQVNRVTVMPFHLDRCFRVGHVSLSIQLAEAGSHAYVGIYDAHGNLLVEGKFPTDAVADLTVDVSPRVLLKPGMYYFAIGGEDATSAAEGYLFDIGDLNFTRSGTATNQIMDGCLPATLGRVEHGIEGSTPSAVFAP
jgi:hypothetical protein